MSTEEVFENNIGVNEVNQINEEIYLDEMKKYSKDCVAEKMYYFINKSSSLLYKSIVTFVKVFGIYFIWICLHYFSAHLYVEYCVPNTLYGFLMSPFIIATPHCQGLRWIVYNAASIINNMWLMIGTWIYSIIWILG